MSSVHEAEEDTAESRSEIKVSEGGSESSEDVALDEIGKYVWF